MACSRQSRSCRRPRRLASAVRGPPRAMTTVIVRVARMRASMVMPAVGAPVISDVLAEELVDGAAVDSTDQLNELIGTRDLTHPSMVTSIPCRIRHPPRPTSEPANLWEPPFVYVINPVRRSSTRPTAELRDVLRFGPTPRRSETSRPLDRRTSGTWLQRWTSE